MYPWDWLSNKHIIMKKTQCLITSKYQSNNSTWAWKRNEKDGEKWKDGEKEINKLKKIGLKERKRKMFICDAFLFPTTKTVFSAKNLTAITLYWHTPLEYVLSPKY